MPPSSGLQMALVRPWLAGMKAALFPLLRSMLPAPERLAAFIPPTSLARLKQPNANSPQNLSRLQPLTSYLRPILGFRWLAVYVCRLLRVFVGSLGECDQEDNRESQNFQPYPTLLVCRIDGFTS